MSDEVHHEVAHADEDENYFISMTDMMVGVLFIFIILLMVFALNFRNEADRAEVSEDQLVRLQDAQSQAEQVTGELDTLQRQFDEQLQAIDQANDVLRDMLEEIQRRLLAANVNVEIDPNTGVLRLTERAVEFEPSESVLLPAQIENVHDIAAVLADVLPNYTACTNPATPCRSSGQPSLIETVFIEGHADQTGVTEKNWSLSTERALVTFRELTAAEATLGALRNAEGQPILSVSGYGSSRPVPNVDVKQYDRHRRIDLRFVMESPEEGRLQSVLSLTKAMQGQLDKLKAAVDRARETSGDAKPSP